MIRIRTTVETGKKKIRILYVGNHASYFLTHRLSTFQALLQSGYEVHVAVPSHADDFERLLIDDARVTIEQLGFCFHNLNLERGSMNPLNELKSVFNILRLYKNTAPSLVFHATIKPVIYGSIIARIVRVPGVVNLVTGLGYIFLASGMKGALLRYLAKQAFRLSLNHPNSFTILQNWDDHRLFLTSGIVDAKKLVVIHSSGVNLETFKQVPEPQGQPIVVLPSRMLWDKGVGEFVEAAKHLKNSGIQARFVLVGDSDPNNPRAISRSQLQSWHESGFIEWWGWRRDIVSVLQGCHVVCLPSYREGIPKSLIEAAACGRPIVATDAPGCREVVRHNENGLLVPLKNTRALTAALKTLITNPELRNRMGKRSREIAEREFSHQVTAQSSLNLCELLLRPVEKAT